MCLELSVHIPAELLCSSLRIVELLLRLTLERVKLFLQNLKLLFGASSCVHSGGLVRANLGGLLRDSDHLIHFDGY